MARKKFMEDPEEQQENVVGIKGYQQNKKNHFASSPPRSGNVLGLGLIHPRSRSNQKLNNASDSPLSAEDSLYSVIKQLSSDGLTIREMPGDGNCLFRALSDQLEGNTRNHIHHRRSVVQYMRENRSDFEPFVEDDQPFDKYVQSLSQPGTFAGNDAIVAFARLHNVTVVIHQLNSPAWLIHPTTDGHTVSSGREVHIAYHNGDHYNSVRKIGDDSDAPAEIRFISQEPLHNSKSVKAKSKQGTTNAKHRHLSSAKSSTITSDQSKSSNNAPYASDLYNESTFSEYWVNDTGDIDNLVDQLVRDTGYPDPLVVRQSLIEFNFDMVLTMNFILSLVMSQIETTEVTVQPTPVMDSPIVNQEVEALAQDKTKVLFDLDTGIGVSNKLVDKACETVAHLPDDSTEGKSNVQPCSGGSNLGSPSPPLRWDSRENSTTEDEDVEFSGASASAARNVSKVKLSNRQKEEVKKRNRKLARLKNSATSTVPNGPCSDTPPSQYSSASSGGLRSLNI